MIIGFFLDLIYSGITKVFSVLPTGNLNPNIQTAFTAIWGYYNKLNGVLPLDTMFQVFLVIVGVDLLLWTITIGMVFLNFLRGRK